MVWIRWDVEDGVVGLGYVGKVVVGENDGMGVVIVDFREELVWVGRCEVVFWGIKKFWGGIWVGERVGNVV